VYFGRLRAAVHLAVRFLDDVIDVSRYPVPELEGPPWPPCKVGLGVMGLAELLATLGIPYDSPAAVALAGRLFRVITTEARLASASLAAKRGPFPLYAQSTYPGRGIGPHRHRPPAPIRSSRSARRVRDRPGDRPRPAPEDAGRRAAVQIHDAYSGGCNAHVCEF